MIVLKRHGFYAVDWSKKRRRDVSKLVDLDSLDLLDRWEDAFTIKGVVRLRDLVRLVSKEFSSTLRNVVGRLARANFSAYLADEELSRPKRGKEDLKAIEVYLRCDLDVGGRHKQGEINISSSASGLAKSNKDGHTSYAIEFTPWGDLLDLPLKVRSCAYFTTTRWRRRTKKEQLADKAKARKARKDRSNVWAPDYPYKLEGTEQKDVEVAMSLGEFLVGLFNELCFFASPAQRNVELAGLVKIANEYDGRRKKKRRSPM